MCSHLLDAAVTALCDGAPLLEELTLWRCASLRAPRIKGAELRLVNLCENALIDDEGAGRIGGACPKLQRLFLAGCAAVTSPLPNGGAHVAELDLANADGLTDGGLSAACAGAPPLERLDISGCSLICQPEWLGGARLRSLRASGCDAIADDAITACCARSPGLTSLTLPLCAALRSPRIGTPALTELNLCGCAALTDAAVEHGGATRRRSSLASPSRTATPSSPPTSEALRRGRSTSRTARSSPSRRSAATASRSSRWRGAPR